MNDGSSRAFPRAGRRAGTCLGATTELWHGQCMRLHEIDLRERPVGVAQRWPLSLAELFAVRGGREVARRHRSGTTMRSAEHPRLEQLAWDESRLRHDFTEYAPDPRPGAGTAPGWRASPRSRWSSTPRPRVCCSTDRERPAGSRSSGPTAPTGSCKAAASCSPPAPSRAHALLQLGVREGSASAPVASTPAGSCSTIPSSSRRR